MRPASPNVLLKASETPFFLVTSPANLRYLTGIPLHSGALLVTSKKFLLFVDDLSRYTADTQARPGITVRSLSEREKYFADIKFCGIEADRVTLAEKTFWKRRFPSVHFVPKSGIVESFRRDKDAEELRYTRMALKITEELLRRVPAMLRRKITEEKLARQLQIWALELGADGMAFDPIVAFGTNTGCPHHVPTGRLLKKGHVVQIDVGVKYRGYSADLSEVFFTAKPTEPQKNMLALVHEAATAAMKKVKVGASTRDLDTTARAVFKREGVEDAFVHSLGHGVGLEIHEGVSLSSKRPDVKLLKNEVITIEPGLYFPGKWGMRIERMMIV
jgi:Xaa-Pro aminopeptidase